VIIYEVPVELKQQQLMKHFWNAKATENAPFYIATWRGYQRKDTEEFFLTAAQASEYLQAARYQPTGMDRMLEIGCGIGRMTHGFAQLLGEVHAIDVSGVMIEQAKQNLAAYPHVYPLETSGTDLAAFADNFFDLCFSFIVFQHIPAKAIIFNYIREVGRVLKPGGTFHFQVNGLPDPDLGVHPALLTVKRLYRSYVRRPALLGWHRVRGGEGGYESPAWAGVSVSRAEVESVCRASGLIIQSVTGEGSQYMWITANKPA
jgi:SAM-dependent methyltransferase